VTTKFSFEGLGSLFSLRAKGGWSILVPASLVLGLISDLMQPLAPFSSYLFLVSALAALFLIIIIFAKATVNISLIWACILAVASAVISGGITILQTDSKDYGVLASQIAAIKTLQSSLGIIQEDVAAIRISTENIDQTTARTEEIVKKVEINTQENTAATNKVAEAVEESTKQIVGSLEEIQKGFSTLAKEGGVIPNPTRPEQIYHNARIQELGGDYGNARQSYGKYFSFKLDFIDPHLRYQSFLKIQEGRAGAREIYSYLYENDPRPIIEYARILLFDAPKKTQMLEDFIKSNPDFAPAYYELSKEYSKARKGSQSLTDKKAEYNAIKQFKALNKEGKLFRYFVDKEIVSNWIIDAEERFKSLSLIAEIFSNSPIEWIYFSDFTTNEKWKVIIAIPEPFRKILYRIDGDTSYKEDTDIMQDFIDPDTGVEYGRRFFNLPLTIDSAKIFIKYLDINNVEQGPFEIEFDGHFAAIRDAKDPDINDPSDWVIFDKEENWYYIDMKGLPTSHVFFSQITNICGISRIMYGIDIKTPNESIFLEECDFTQALKYSPMFYPHSFPGINFISYQHEYRDGTTSEIKIFQSPYDPEFKFEYYDNGQIKSKSTVNQGWGNGVFSLWYENGQKKREINTKDGKKDGKGTWWHENGQIYSQGSYKNNKEDGMMTFWYENGQIKQEGSYRLGNEYDKWTWWYENGQIKHEGSYRHGKKVGKFTEWDENAQIKSESIWKDGECISGDCNRKK
jgi:antitoxin component YwqK of YwqJK toxin-antitoxin module